MLTPPLRQPLTLCSEMPAPLRRPLRSDWADLNMGGRELGCFLEGPVLDEAGNLFVADIPFDRIRASIPRVSGPSSRSTTAGRTA